MKQRIITITLIILLLFNISLITATNLNLKIETHLKNNDYYNFDFYLKTYGNSNSGFDSYDFPAPTLPSNYSQFCSFVDGMCLSIDSFNNSEFPRTVNLLYNISDSLSDYVDFNWSLQDGYIANFKDYGADSSYTNLLNEIDMKTNNKYERQLTNKKLYFQIVISPDNNNYDTGGGGPNQHPDLPSYQINKTILCNALKDFVSNHTNDGVINYTDNEIKTIKPSIDINLGFSIDYVTLRSFISNYDINCIIINNPLLNNNTNNQTNTINKKIKEKSNLLLYVILIVSVFMLIIVVLLFLKGSVIKSYLSDKFSNKVEK